MDLLQKLKTIDDLPTIPTTLVKVLRVTGRETTGAEDLARVIVADQSLAAKILKVANSALYSLPRKVDNIHRAVALLGFNEVRDISLGVSVFDSLYLPIHGAYWNRAQFWEHCFVVGFLSRELAREAGHAAVEDAFAAGLLHDIGKVLLDRHFSEVFRKIIEQADERQASFYEVEQEILGAGHDAIGGYLLSLWNLPDQLVAGISGHHRPSEESDPTGALVYLANMLAHVGGFPSMPIEPEMTLDEMLALPETIILRQTGRLPATEQLQNLLMRLDENAEELSAQAAMLL